MTGWKLILLLEIIIQILRFMFFIYFSIIARDSFLLFNFHMYKRRGKKLIVTFQVLINFCRKIFSAAKLLGWINNTEIVFLWISMTMFLLCKKGTIVEKLKKIIFRFGLQTCYRRHVGCLTYFNNSNQRPFVLHLSKGNDHLIEFHLIF